MTLKEVQSKIYDKLKPSGWGGKLNTFLLSDEFYQILLELQKQSNEGNKFTPVLKQTFRAFTECPYDSLKVVIIGQDPYPQVGVADGISFSCSNTGKVQPSLRYIFEEVERTVYPEGKEMDPDLTRWANQGVLMLNTALTTNVNKIGAHYELWKPFTLNLLNALATYNTGIIYVFLGNKAKEWHKEIPGTNYKLFAPHPAAGAYNGQKWNSGNLFNQINKVLQKNNGEQIIW